MACCSSAAVIANAFRFMILILRASPVIVDARVASSMVLLHDNKEAANALPFLTLLQTMSKRASVDELTNEYDTGNNWLVEIEERIGPLMLIWVKAVEALKIRPQEKKLFEPLGFLARKRNR
eukprot:1150275-Pelagomonas_calceolata.AAC.8